MSARAISEIASAPRSLSWPPVTRRPTELKESRTSRLRTWNAGAKPNRMPVTVEMPKVNASTQPSILIISVRGTFPAGAKASRAGTPQNASKSPATPPASESTVLSVSNWRTSRQRPAPNALRTAISCPRPAARTKNRLATLAHAISSTNDTAPVKTTSAGRIFATNKSLSGIICGIRSFSPGARGRCPAKVCTSALAC